MKVREMDIEFYRHYMANLEAKAGPKWQYDERKSCGVNYSSILSTWFYDRRHLKFRDFKAESEEIVAILGLRNNATVIDMGCGTGAFAVNAAAYYNKIYAVDVSNSMLRCARRKARKAKLTNIEFHRGGFLTYEHEAEPVDAIVSVIVMHHLPDFWKLIGLRRLAQMLKAGGKLFLRDVVCSFDIARYKHHIEDFIQSVSEQTGPAGQWEAEIHFRREYSTYGWIMEGLLERAGFKIEKADYKDGFFAEYLCTKKSK